MIRVFLIDDHQVVRTAIAHQLSSGADIDIVGQASDGESGLAEVHRCKPDIVLCDLHLPGISGFDVVDRLVRGSWGGRVIVLSAQEDGPLPKRLLKAGAAGYLTKACSSEELLRAVRQVHDGKRFISAALAQRLALEEGEGDSPFDQLSRRELEVAIGLAKGQSMTEVAERLHIAPKTVATHKYNLFAKLEIGDLVGLVRLARQYGLIDEHA